MKIAPRCSVGGCWKAPIIEVGPSKLHLCHQHQLEWEHLYRPWFGKVPTNIRTKPGTTTQGRQTAKGEQA